jgi:hypothetical protein
MIYLPAREIIGCIGLKEFTYYRCGTVPEWAIAFTGFQHFIC